MAMFGRGCGTFLFLFVLWLDASLPKTHDRRGKKVRECARESCEEELPIDSAIAYLSIPRFSRTESCLAVASEVEEGASLLAELV